MSTATEQVNPDKQTPQTNSLTNEDYDERRRLLDELKGLSKPEQLKVFQILRETAADFSENSNGIFFDVAKVSVETFRALRTYMDFCHDIRKDQAAREAEMEELR